MLNILNRTILLKETSAEAAAKARSALEQVGIPFKASKESSGPAKSAVRIPRSGRTGNMGTDPYSNSYTTGGVPHSWTEVSSAETLYIIYVSKKDLKKAKEVCDIG